MDESKFKHTITKAIIYKAKRMYADDNLVLAIPQFISRHFNAYAFMKMDIERVLEYCEELKKDHSKLIRSALTYSSITLYAKCFMDASRGKAPKLEASQIFSEKTNIEIHEYLMELRHKFLVHRNENNAEIEAAFFLIPKADNEVSSVQHLATKQIAFHEDKLEDIVQHLGFLISVITTKLERTTSKIQKAMFALDPEITKILLVNNIN